MAHGITTQDTMFSVKKTPWHKLGTVLDNIPTVEDALVFSGLDYEVGLEPLFTAIGSQTELRAPANATINKRTGEILGVVGEKYKPLQNMESFSFFNPFIESGMVSLETAGSLFGGRKTFVLAKINKDPLVIVPQSNDVVESYILLSNSHDGTLAVRVGYTPIRVVCNNTLTMAHGKNSKSSLIKVKHGSKTKENLELIRETMNLVHQNFEATAEQYKILASKQISESDLKKYINIVFSLDDPEKEIDEKPDFENEVKKRKSRVLEPIMELFETGKGNYLPGVKGTQWAAYNAVTEYLTHYRGQSEETRFNSLMFLDGAKLNQKALNTLITL